MERGEDNVTRQINPAGLQIIKQNEGCRLTAYLDVAGIWTIGFGSTPAHHGQTITQAEADALLVQDVSHACAAVDGATHDVPTTDNQFSSMVSLCYNIGAGAFRGSTVLRLHRAKQYQGAGDAFLRWNKSHVDGTLVILAGLTKRREQERELYLTS
jgi:lysozyme